MNNHTLVYNTYKQVKQPFFFLDMKRFVIVLFILIVCTCSVASMGFNFTCKETERNTLLEFKHSFPSYSLNSSKLFGSWVGENCCKWNGVGCDDITGNVIKLDLRGNSILSSSYFIKLDLRGNSILSSSYLVAKEVNPCLVKLKYLRYLDLSGNDFQGSRIPKFFGSIKQLEYLNLSNAFFTGKVPHHLGNLTKLVVLDLSFQDNRFNATETKSLEWAFKLENLQYLDLSGINMSQALDTLNILHNLPSLLELKLSHCQLGNSHLLVPNSTISSIEYIGLAHNYFNATFPHFFKNLTFLVGVDLSFNLLTYSIPSWLANKTHLEFLSLSNNHINRVDGGGIMNIIGRVCTLKHLDISYNQLQEEIFELDVMSLRCNNRYDLQYLDLQNNNLSGHLPTIGSMLSLKVLDLSHNRFDVIPASFGEFSSLVSVDLSYNRLRVVHQKNLVNLSSLKNLDLSSNSLSIDLSPDWLPPFQLESLHMLPCKVNGPFPKWLLSQEKILDLDLSNAGIFGPLPSNIGNIMTSLWSLRLSNNSINGSIPRSLCKLVSLRFLDLQENSLSGKIPDCWENSQIFGLELSSNKLSGPIPNSLAIYGTLQVLSLNSNLLEGELPLTLNNCEELMVLDVGKNNLHGKIPSWNGLNFPLLQIFILRENKFNNIIPSELCSIDTLRIIDLASNDLGGTIPQCFGHFEGMGSIETYEPSASPIASFEVDAPLPSRLNPDEWSAVEVIKGEEREYTTVLHLLVNMDLSCNNLVGMIPTKFTSLFLLVNLNLSHNHLTGVIPKEIGKMKFLESVDLSSNNLSGSIPESVTSLDYLSRLNLSFNNLQGQIPTGNQLRTLEDPFSIYMGNPGLCGDPLPRKCFNDNISHPPTNTIIEDVEDYKHEKMWFYLVIMLGFATGFWGVIATLIFKRRWRHAYFHLAEELVDWIYVKVAVRIAQVKQGR